METDLDYLRDLPVSREIAEHDTMFVKGGERHYFCVGLSNIYAISNACRIRSGVPDGDPPILDILDFGCGYGRVARFLRAGFADARVW